MAVLKSRRPKKAAPDESVFQAAPGKKLSNMSMAMLLRRMDRDNITVHGFRSTFRDWAGETTSFAREVIETALAHAVESKTERAYRRGRALEKRRELMDAWSAYCGPRIQESETAAVTADEVAQRRPTSKST